MLKLSSILRRTRAGRAIAEKVSAQAFSGSASERARAEDVAFCYRFFLGRDPENQDVVSSRVGLVLGAVATSFLNSSEFAMVYASSRLAGSAESSAGAEQLAVELGRWASQLGNAGEDIQNLAVQRPAWLDFLSRWLRDPAVQANFPIINSALEVPVIGHVDEVSLWRVFGWAMDPTDPSRKITVRILANGEPLGSARADLARSDVGRYRDAVPKCGFSFSIRRNQLIVGKRYAITIVDAANGRTIGTPGRITADVQNSRDEVERLRAQLDDVQRTLSEIRARIPLLDRSASYPLDAYEYHADLEEEERSSIVAAAYRRLPKALPSVCFIVASERLDPELTATFISIRNQIAENWTLIFFDLSNDAAAGSDALMRVFRDDPRVHRIEGSAGMGEAIAQSTADYIWPVAVGSRMSPDAVYHAMTRAAETDAAAVYTDHDHLAETPDHLYEAPSLKADFDYDLLLASDYIGPAVALNAVAAKAAGAAQTTDLGALRYELLLCIAEEARHKRIEHVPLPLVHLSRYATPNAANRVDLLNRHFQSRGIGAQAEAHADPVSSGVPRAARIRWALPDPAPSAAIVIPTRDGLAFLRDCVTSILNARDAYPGEQEIIIVDNGSREPETLAYFDALRQSGSARIIPYDLPFNWSAINNHAASLTKADVLVFLNNDTVVQTDDWLVELASLAMRPDVGAVGARLLYDDGSVQHAGVVSSYPRGFIHDSIGTPEGDGGYGDRIKLTRETMAATGACLASRRSVFEQVGGFDDVQFKIAYNDMDYCLRLRRAGYRILYASFAVLYHFESKTRGQALFGEKLARERLEADRLFKSWNQELQHDPFYNQNFDRFSAPFDRIRPHRYSAGG